MTATFKWSTDGQIFAATPPSMLMISPEMNRDSSQDREQHQIRDIARIAGALDDLREVEHPFEDVVAAVRVFARPAGRAGGEDLTGADAVDADVVAAADAGHVAGEGIDAGLGGVVGRGRGAELVLHARAEAALRGERGHVDHGAAAGGHEVRPNCLADVERAG